MRKVSSMRKVHTEHGISWLEPRSVRTDICCRTTQGLDVCMISTKKCFGAVDSKLFDLVGIFLSSIIPSSWCSFTVFICKDRSLCRKHCGRLVVFTCDKFHTILLSFFFEMDKIIHFTISMRYFFCHRGDIR